MTDGQCAIAAAILTHGVVGNLQTQAVIPADGKLLDQWTKAKNYYEFEVFKVFYNGISQIATDPADWPPPAQYASNPNAPAPTLDPNFLGQLQALVKQFAGPIAGAIGGPVGAAVGQAVGNIPNPTVTPPPTK